MRKAIELSIENVANGGGPFGAVIAKNGEIIATGVNRVTASCDPTAHAEVSAIRAAAAKLGTFDLSGYEIYTSCEPCPMCLGAIYWARLDKMYYANNKTDAKNIGFDDSFIYDELELKPENRKLPSAIRAAAAKLGTFDLSGYEIYTSCEPCPMCLGAIYWARLDKMYYANNKTDAKNIGFDDSFIYDELELKPENRKLPSEVMLREEAIKAFEAWSSKTDKIEY